MKIIADENIPYLRGRLEKQGIDVQYVGQFSFTPENVADADALLIRTRTRCNEALLRGSKVRLVATATIGTDQIDMDWCAANGVHVSNSPGCNAPGVAQYVWSALLRTGFNPATDTLGIVGCGNVGSIIYDWGRRLGVKILVSDPPRQEREEAQGLEPSLPYCPLETLLKQSDAVTLHTPLTHGGNHPTFHLIGEKELDMMRKGTILVNAARGPVVDFSSLKGRVLDGTLTAIIDTWEGEPRVDRELLKAVRYGTFHIAGYSRQGKERATRMVLEAVEKEFGLKIDKSGLEGVYEPPKALNAEAITASYDPATDTEALRNNPEAFDSLRNNYQYREEVKC